MAQCPDDLAATLTAATVAPAGRREDTSIPDTLTHVPASAVATRTGPDAPLPARGPIGAIPGYVILDELGHGGMGVVYKAQHVALDRVVALKMILVRAHARPKDLERFRAEAQAVARGWKPTRTWTRSARISGSPSY